MFLRYTEACNMEEPHLNTLVFNSLAAGLVSSLAMSLSREGKAETTSGLDDFGPKMWQLAAAFTYFGILLVDFFGDHSQ